VFMYTNRENTPTITAIAAKNFFIP